MIELCEILQNVQLSQNPYCPLLLSMYLLVCWVSNLNFDCGILICVALYGSYFSQWFILVLKNLWSWIYKVQNFWHKILGKAEVQKGDGIALIFFCLISQSVNDCLSMLGKKCFVFNFSPANKVLSCISMKQKENNCRANCRLSLKLISCIKLKTMWDFISRLPKCISHAHVHGFPNPKSYRNLLYFKVFIWSCLSSPDLHVLIFCYPLYF